MTEPLSFAAGMQFFTILKDAQPPIVARVPHNACFDVSVLNIGAAELAPVVDSAMRICKISPATGVEALRECDTSRDAMGFRLAV